jgi:hypothetical protein
LIDFAKGEINKPFVLPEKLDENNEINQNPE